MYFSTLAMAALLSGLAIAAPAGTKFISSRQVFPSIPITFNGAAGASYTISVLANSAPILTNNDLSITSISMEGRASFVCTAYGIDGSVTNLVASQVRKNSPRTLFRRGDNSHFITSVFKRPGSP